MIFCSWGIYPVQTDGHEKIHSAIVLDGYNDYKHSKVVSPVHSPSLLLLFISGHVIMCVQGTLLLVTTCNILGFFLGLGGQVFVLLDFLIRNMI